MHEEWAIATIISMPNLQVQFNTIREAYVKLNNVFDRDYLVSEESHLFTDVLSSMKSTTREINDAVSKFRKIVMWDRVRSTKANLMLKVKVEELSDIPSSIVFGDGTNLDSLTVPVVILQHEVLGVEPQDEDPIHPFGNPHPIPLQENYHPTQHNHFVGPLQHHEHEVGHAEEGLHADEEEEMTSPLINSMDSATTSTTSALHSKKKRKGKVPLVDSEVAEKNTTEEVLAKKAKMSKQPTGSKKSSKNTSRDKGISKEQAEV
ncbi:hypothetical protein D1007_35272 [Hordeum vulgare]|nr:hypothetical protein D1007_35272 [Hordeum vulgare]